MIRTLHRVRGASQLGARQPGERGPFGVRPDEGDVQDDEQHDQDHDDLSNADQSALPHT